MMLNHEETTDIQKESNLNRNPMFSEEKCRAPAPGWNKPMHQYGLGSDGLYRSPAGKDLGAMVGTRWNMN